ncbi:hypothetical protein MATR_23500 [Marivirga tractuosa]|uniref:Lipoprotein n=1 Tax=Marivirga tractuosa (strain ATCC 23168 / DSM 4126 / NBRC 15989 / NCIMB 1408 / VKM B-1430 / H-43) TaxID=643867 RepID=E4TUR5_MARTH|nr:hypothetical protein [Marivirga tractuosa]ADR20043.1 hypothetical protein Ftrac_0026 [Marivirga tractuosa DSM 4126]BDD15525.1 hypothetical protein MATR_23500 [Marivirga tractuosa]
MKKHIHLYIVVMLVFTACKDKMVCAAFQSSYILDEEEQKKRFSLFEGDSLVLTASASTSNYKTNIYGISEKKYGYWKEQALLKVKQKNVYSEEVDSLLDVRKNGIPEMAEGGEVQEKSPFTPELDSAQLAQGEDAWDNTKRFNYNVDFVNYMLLVGNDVLKQQAVARDSAQAKAERNELAQSSDSTANEKKGFLKRIFSPKEKTEDVASDSSKVN